MMIRSRSLLIGLHTGFGLHADATSACVVGFDDAFPAQDVTTCREVGTLDEMD